MAKELGKVVKLQVRGGAANPSPPVGPALGAAGVNIMEFCKQFNARTQDKAGKVLPVVISVYKDKSFDFVIKTPPAAVQLMEAAKLKKANVQLEMAAAETKGMNLHLEEMVAERTLELSKSEKKFRHLFSIWPPLVIVLLQEEF